MPPQHIPTVATVPPPCCTSCSSLGVPSLVKDVTRLRGDRLPFRPRRRRRSLLFIVSHFRWSTSCSDWAGDRGQNQLEINFMLWLPAMTHVSWPWIRHFCVVGVRESRSPGVLESFSPPICCLRVHFLTKLARQWHELKGEWSRLPSDSLISDFWGWLTNCRWTA